MLSNREDIYQIFSELGNELESQVKALVIGGAVLLEFDLKIATKDIDIVCISQEDRTSFLNCAERIGFKLKVPEERHNRLVLERIAVRDVHTIDAYARKISNGFGLTPEMWNRGKIIKRFGPLELKYASMEDVFAMKVLAHRAGDLEDCAKLIVKGLDYEVIYSEIKSQYDHEVELSLKEWITHLDEGIGELENEFGVSVPIADKISALSDDYYNNWAPNKHKAMLKQVKEEMNHLPKGDFPQNKLRMYYQLLRMHSLGKKAKAKKSKEEILEEAIDAVKKDHSTFAPNFDPEFFNLGSSNTERLPK